MEDTIQEIISREDDIVNAIQRCADFIEKTESELKSMRLSLDEVKRNKAMLISELELITSQPDYQGRMKSKDIVSMFEYGVKSIPEKSKLSNYALKKLVSYALGSDHKLSNSEVDDIVERVTDNRS